MKLFKEKYRGLTVWFVYLFNMIVLAGVVAMPMVKFGMGREQASAYAMAFTSLLTLLVALKFYQDTIKEAWQKITFPDIILACSVGLGIRIVLTMILFSVMTVQEPENQEILQSMFENSSAGIMFFTVCIFAPIVEELLFRQILIGDLVGKVSVQLMTIVSSLFFIMMHSGLDFKAGLLYATVTIPLVGVYRYYQNNVVISMSMHFVMNSLAFIGMVAQTAIN